MRVEEAAWPAEVQMDATRAEDHLEGAGRFPLEPSEWAHHPGHPLISLWGLQGLGESTSQLF